MKLKIKYHFFSFFNFVTQVAHKKNETIIIFDTIKKTFPGVCTFSHKQTNKPDKCTQLSSTFFVFEFH